MEGRKWEGYKNQGKTSCTGAGLEKAGIPTNAITKYFKLYGLRTHGTLNNNLVTEIIYVHSKMVVVDDCMHG